MHMNDTNKYISLKKNAKHSNRFENLHSKRIFKYESYLDVIVTFVADFCSKPTTSGAVSDTVEP